MVADESLSEKKRHPIQAVARRTGLSQEVLRVWEKRYAAVTPGRTASGRRLYSDGDILRLQLLRAATLLGRRIGTVAGLSQEELTVLVEEDRRAQQGASSPAPTSVLPSHQDVTGMVDACLQATMALDARRLEAILRRAQVVFSSLTFLENVIAPLVKAIGDLWREGRLDPYHEHLATAVIRRLVGEMVSAPPADDAPVLVVATPVGQRHEIGALLVAATAVGEGWQVAYLGADLPAADIARAAKDSRANAVAISIVHPADDPGIPAEVKDLRRRLPEGVALFAGGGAAKGYEAAFRRLGLRILPDLAALRQNLAQLRIPHD